MAEKTLKQLREAYPDIKSNSKKGFIQKLKVSRGLGDVMEAVTESTGIKAAVEFFTPEGKDCGCSERKERWNKKYNWKQVNCMQQSEYDWFTSFKKRYEIAVSHTGSGQISKIDIYELHRLYRRLFRINLKICSNCPSAAGVIKEAVKNIDKIYDSYEI